MCDKESIEIFEKIWPTDIINKTEPLYSIATCVLNRYIDEHPCGSDLNGHPCDLNSLLLDRIIAKWDKTLTDHINTMPAPHMRITTMFSDLREQYKDNRVIIQIINRITAKITSGI